jgi:uracil-DNA glycosylase family 4
MSETGEEIRKELLDIVQTLRNCVELDVEHGRPVSYLRNESLLKPMDYAAYHDGNDILPSGCSSFPDSEAQQSVTLEGVRGELGECQRCPLGQTKTHLVFGEGDSNADLVFVGEAPGADEDAQGRPFVGRAGQLLTKIISAMGLSRERVYICNILKCRPPENRNPKPEEIAACEPFLIRQLQAIHPKVICAMGTFAAQTLLKTDAPIGTLRGRLHSYQGIQLMPTYHPAYLLRNPGAKRQVWEDVQKVMEILNGKDAEDS